jgi:hypothetical protein
MVSSTTGCPPPSAAARAPSHTLASPPPATPQRRRAAALEAASPGDWPAALLQHPAVCEDPAVVLRLLATSRALGDASAAAAGGRLRLTLGGDGEYDYVRAREGSLDKDEARRQLCRAEAAFVERRGDVLAELLVKEWSGYWHRTWPTDHADRPIERVLAPALGRAAAAGRLAGLRAFEAPGFGLEGGLLRALALCPALTRLSLGDATQSGCYVYAGDSTPNLRAVGGQLAALRGLRELGLGLGCMRAAAPALACLSALTRLTRLRLALVGLPGSDEVNTEAIQLSRAWSGLHALPASLLDLSLSADVQVRRGAQPGRAGPGRGVLGLAAGSRRALCRWG